MKAFSKSVAAILLMVTCSCSTPAVITNTWHRSNTPTAGYNNIFIAALTTQIKDKQQIEDNVQRILQEKGLKVEKSIDLFPPKLVRGRIQSESIAIGKITPTGADGILIINLMRKEKEPHFVSLAPWEPVGADYVLQHLDNLPDNFSYDGFYKDDIVYYVETKFYSMKSKKLVWAAESKTYDPNNMEGFVQGYIQTIYERMEKEGVIAMNAARK